MHIIQTQFPTALQKNAIFHLWNSEYPSSISYQSIDQLDAYLNGLSETNHFFMVDDGDTIAGWAITFMRDDAKWFAIIVDKAFQGKKIGSLLIQHLMNQEPELNGWVMMQNDCIKNDGSLYASPTLFYSKNGFQILSDIKLENDKMSAGKIQWKKD